MIKPLFQNILVMVNGTEASINAVRYAVLMAKLYRCHVHAVYVVDTATIKQLALNKIFIEEESRDYERSLTENGMRYLAYVEELGKAKGVKIETELKSGAIGTEVIALAEERHIDAILIDGQGLVQIVQDLENHPHPVRHRRLDVSVLSPVKVDPFGVPCRRATGISFPSRLSRKTVCRTNWLPLGRRFAAVSR